MRGPDGAPARIVEHRDASAAELQIEEINAGIYDFDAGFLRQAVAELSADNDQGELYLTDVLAAAGGDAIALCIDDPSEAIRSLTAYHIAELGLTELEARLKQSAPPAESSVGQVVDRAIAALRGEVHSVA